jgi:hypothetical protein
MTMSDYLAYPTPPGTSPDATAGRVLSGLAQTCPAGFYFIHLFTAADGRSRIEQLNPAQATEKLPYFFRAVATGVSLLTFPAGHNWDWHLTREVPRLIVQLRGMAVTIVDDGADAGVSYHPLRPGSVLLAEDFSGRGHRGMIFPDEPVVSLQVDLVKDWR